jgi:CDP-diacylglycerol--glycerol-3-phosphate 3-phosphatidyltransferase
MAAADVTAVAQPGLVNVANTLTVLRLVMVPAFVLFLLAGGTGYRVAACVTFGVASVTDLLDGEIARRRGLITDFGKIADPIADKALIGSALVTLSALGQLSWWVTVVILLRELTVTGLRFWVIRQGVIAASRGGKIKTLLQVVAIGLYILPGPLSVPRQIVMAAAVAVTLVTGADYVVRAMRLHRAVPHAHGRGQPTVAGSAAGAVADSAAGFGASAAAVAGQPGRDGPAGDGNVARHADSASADQGQMEPPGGRPGATQPGSDGAVSPPGDRGSASAAGDHGAAGQAGKQDAGSAGEP